MATKKSDYRELLIRYIMHVGKEEGISYLEDIDGANCGPFTRAEAVALRELDDEANRRWNQDYRRAQEARRTE
jgi:hypothetical protein